MTPITSEQFAVLWAEAQPKVAGFILSMIPDFHQADDVLQNVAVIATSKQEQFDGSRPFLNWVIQIARFEVLKHRRTIARESVYFNEPLVSMLADEFEKNPSQQNRLQELVVYCIKQLKGRSREVLKLRHVSGFTPPQIAKHLDISPEAVRSLLCRTRKLVRHCVSQHVQSNGISHG